MSLGEILIRLGKATPEQVSAALKKQDQSPGKDVGRILADDGAISEASLLEALGEQYGAEVVLSVSDDMLDPLLVTNLPVEWARTQCLLPVRWNGGLAVLTCDPTAVSAFEDLALLLGRELTPVLAPREEIAKGIERCYFQKKDSAEELLRDMEQGEAAPKAPVKAADDLLRITDHAPVTQLVNVILLEALKARASDVHVEPFENRVRVRYRIDGLLYEQASPPKHMESTLVSRLKVMAKLDIAEKRLPQDGTARVRVGEREVDIRVSTVPVAEGERVVLRLLNRESALLPLTALGMPDDLLRRFRAVIREPNGVVLVTGPTGSGKTTTLYAALQEIDTEHMNVLTIEDPVEYQIARVGQIQVKPKIGLTFASGLRHILRQDPDVILVGEIRDLETAEIVVRAALTGHLVFSTLHTNDAPGAVLRLLDMGIEPYLLSSAVKASLAQRLVRVLCPKCRAPSALTAGDAALFGPGAEKQAGGRCWTPAGCPDCLGGYLGRTGLYEFMEVRGELQDSIRAGITLAELRARVAAQGMKSLLDDALEKVLDGTTSVSEVKRAVGMPAAEPVA